ncbi:MAG: hypothetical protein PVG22_16060 [Chromatiales bacterium]|jgi:hypothetical protein
MQLSTLTSTTIIVAAVLLFVIMLILLLVMVDHKARITGDERRDLFRITGKRKNHPIWSYLIGSIVLTIIGAVGYQLSASMLQHTSLGNMDDTSIILKDIAAEREAEAARHFHHLSNNMALDGEKSVCYYCHGDFPHSEKRMIRTLLNMHTQFIGCMTCHVDPKKIDEKNIELKWLNYSGIDVSGPPFGTDYDGETGFLITTDDVYSKIVPYLQQDNDQKLLEIRETDPIAVDFVKVQEQLQGQDRDLVKKSFHRNVSPKGRFCTKCHTQQDKSYIPFEELGFSDRRVNELTNLNIIGLVQKYKKFYMPELLTSGAEKVDVKTLLGPEVELPKQEQQQDDPKGWWRSSEAPAEAN